jgi:hypothetical protein
LPPVPEQWHWDTDAVNIEVPFSIWLNQLIDGMISDWYIQSRNGLTRVGASRNATITHVKAWGSHSAHSHVLADYHDIESVAHFLHSHDLKIQGWELLPRVALTLLIVFCWNFPEPISQENGHISYCMNNWLKLLLQSSP